MKPIVLYLQKQNLIIGIIVAFALVFFLKLNSKAPAESFLSLQALSSLCNRKYTPQTTRAGIPKVKPRLNVRPLCRFGININPPSPFVKKALTTLTPINPGDVSAVGETISTLPEFENILNSPVKQDVLKELIVLNTLLKSPPANITEEEIQHIAITILSDINTVDPQLASLASAHYSNTEDSPDTKPLYKSCLSKSYVKLRYRCHKNNYCRTTPRT